MTRKLFLVTVVLLLLTPALFGQTRSELPNTPDSKLRFAASQHEIISILIQEQDFGGALLEFRRILALELSEEGLVVDEAWLIVDRLMAAGRYEYAHQIIDDTLETIEIPKNRFSLMMLKGKVYKDEGKLKDAVRVYREAQRLRE
jgi:hypothetical protein